MEETFARYVKEHRALLYKVCRMFEREPAAQEDLSQEILLQLWRAFPRYDERFKWTTWAYRIALNVAISHQRKAKTTILVTTEPLPELPMPTDGGSEQSDALWAAIASLNPAEKALLLLYFDELPYAAIAEISGLSESNVGVRINRIKQKLKTRLAHGTEQP